ncbi:hypothetical protein AB0917_28750, partial [Streptomyces sp. NPDC007346]
ACHGSGLLGAPKISDTAAWKERADHQGGLDGTGTQLRWSAPKLIAAANEQVPNANVRALHVLAPAPMKARSAPAGCRTGPAAGCPGWSGGAPDAAGGLPPRDRGAPLGRSAVPDIAQAVERQNQAMRELSRRAFPEPPMVPDDAPAPIDQARIQRRRQAAATEAGALRRARDEKGGRDVAVPQRLDQAA